MIVFTPSGINNRDFVNNLSASAREGALLSIIDSLDRLINKLTSPKINEKFLIKRRWYVTRAVQFVRSELSLGHRRPSLKAIQKYLEEHHGFNSSIKTLERWLPNLKEIENQLLKKYPSLSV